MTLLQVIVMEQATAGTPGGSEAAQHASYFTHASQPGPTACPPLPPAPVPPAPKRTSGPACDSGARAGEPAPAC
jgi:hypothetical protein